MFRVTILAVSALHLFCYRSLAAPACPTIPLPTAVGIYDVNQGTPAPRTFNVFPGVDILCPYNPTSIDVTKCPVVTLQLIDEGKSVCLAYGPYLVATIYPNDTSEPPGYSLTTTKANIILNKAGSLTETNFSPYNSSGVSYPTTQNTYCAGGTKGYILPININTYTGPAGGAPTGGNDSIGNSGSVAFAGTTSFTITKKDADLNTSVTTMVKIIEQSPTYYYVVQTTAGSSTSGCSLGMPNGTGTDDQCNNNGFFTNTMFNGNSIAFADIFTNPNLTLTLTSVLPGTVEWRDQQGGLYEVQTNTTTGLITKETFPGGSMTNTFETTNAFELASTATTHSGVNSSGQPVSYTETTSYTGYDPNGGPLLVTLDRPGVGIFSTAYTYNTNGSPATMAFSEGSTKVASTAYGYNAAINGVPTLATETETDTYPGTATNIVKTAFSSTSAGGCSDSSTDSFGNTQFESVDAFGRLTSARVSDGTNSDGVTITAFQGDVPTNRTETSSFAGTSFTETDTVPTLTPTSLETKESDNLGGSDDRKVQLAGTGTITSSDIGNDEFGDSFGTSETVTFSPSSGYSILSNESGVEEGYSYASYQGAPTATPQCEELSNGAMSCGNEQVYINEQLFSQDGSVQNW